MSDLIEEWQTLDVTKDKSFESQKKRVKEINDKARTASYRQNNKSQAIMRVSGFLSNADKAYNHLSYISRNNDIEIEDELGYRYKERQDIEDMIDEWSADFTPIKEGEDKDRLSLIVHADNPEATQALYHKLNNLRKDQLEEYDVRVDKSRSKKEPNRVYLRASVDPNDRAELFNKLSEIATIDLQNNQTKIEERKAKLPRNAMKMVLSTPSGTDQEKAMQAARQFAKEEFGNLNYRYMMALHTDTDNPHVHLVVKGKSEDVIRLDTSKSQLHRWRSQFAEKCRENDIEVESSYRSQRGVGKKGVKQAVYFKHQRGQSTHYEANKQQRSEAAYKTGEYIISGPEIAQLRRNIKERQDFVKEAKYLRTFASTLSDKEKQRKLIKTAVILEKEAAKLPMPKTSDKEMVDKKAKEEGKKVAQVMPDSVKSEVRSALAKISDQLNGKQNVTVVKASKHHDQEKDQGLDR